MLLGLGSSGPQVSEGWHGVRFASSFSGRASTWRSCGWRVEHKKVDFTARRWSCRCQMAGKVLKRPFRRAGEDPDLSGSVGPKNVAWPARSQTAGSRFSSHQAHTLSCARRSKRAPRARASLDDFRICPSVNVMISDDLDVARTRCARCWGCTSVAWGRASRTSTTASSRHTGFEREAQQRSIASLYGLEVELLDLLRLALESV